jgi:hypothetical protein
MLAERSTRRIEKGIMGCREMSTVDPCPFGGKALFADGDCGSMKPCWNAS